MPQYSEEQIRDALQGSVEKWRKIIAGTGSDEGTDNCPLCHLFYKHNCYGCHVYEASGEKYCNNTPYEDWIGDGGCDYVHSCPTCRRNAYRELKFLEKLLYERDPLINCSVVDPQGRTGVVLEVTALKATVQFGPDGPVERIYRKDLRLAPSD